MVQVLCTVLALLGELKVWQTRNRRELLGLPGLLGFREPAMTLRIVPCSVPGLSYSGTAPLQSPDTPWLLSLGSIVIRLLMSVLGSMKRLVLQRRPKCRVTLCVTLTRRIRLCFIGILRVWNSRTLVVTSIGHRQRLMATLVLVLLLVVRPRLIVVPQVRV